MSIVIELPRQEMKESFAKHEDRQFYFDDPPGPRVDPGRWGGGIPLILSGPAADRAILRDASDEQLEIFGFTDLLMRLTLTRDNGGVVVIEIGDSVPDGHAYYVRVTDSGDVYTVDGTWYVVVERLVLDPPYRVEEEEG